MKKILAVAIAMVALVFSCSPVQKLVVLPANRNEILTDSCDISVMNQLRVSLDTIGYDHTEDQTRRLEAILNASDCRYYASEFYPPREDSSVWLLTIRPVMLGKEELILGNLYTFYPQQDSSIFFQRRIKEYSQTKEFESGKYVVFTYYIEEDTTTIVKKGIGLY